MTIVRAEAPSFGRGFEQPLQRYGEEHFLPVMHDVGNLEEVLGLEHDTSPALGIEYDPAELVEIIKGVVEKDVKEFGKKKLLDSRRLVLRATDVHHIYIADTDMPIQNTVAEYLGAFAEIVLADKEVQQASVEQLFQGIPSELEQIDQLAA